METQEINSIKDLDLGDTLVNQIGEECEVKGIAENVVMLDNYQWYDLERLNGDLWKLLV